MDYGIRIAGLDASNGGFERALVFVNTGPGSIGVQNLTDMALVLASRDSDATCSKNGVALDSNGADRQCYDGTSHLFYGKPVKVAQGLTVNTNVGPDGSGLKHQRLSTGSVTASATLSVSFSWTTSFGDGFYTASCTMEDTTGSLRVISVTSKTGPSMNVVVHNDDAGNAHTGTLNCIGMHD